jgi:hypothetical protein
MSYLDQMVDVGFGGSALPFLIGVPFRGEERGF